MKKTILTFGLISGALSSLLMVLTIPFEDKIGFSKAEFVGYSVIVLSFLLVFFGIRSYRDHSALGQITFLRALAVGLSITLITCLCYTITWEILYFNFMHDFMDKYAAHLVNKLKASGATQAAIQTQIQQLKKYKELYENPLYNSATTFMEPFPVGLLISLVSAIFLRSAKGADARRQTNQELRPNRPMPPTSNTQTPPKTPVG